MSTYFRALANLTEGTEDAQRLQAINRELSIRRLPTVTMPQYVVIAQHFGAAQTLGKMRGNPTASADTGITAGDLKPGV
jgi:hypothetical protein